jgi:hypothetical protein
VAAIHFPETVQERGGLWKMDGRDKPGHDGFGRNERLPRAAFVTLAAPALPSFGFPNRYF